MALTANARIWENNGLVIRVGMTGMDRKPKAVTLCVRTQQLCDCRNTREFTIWLFYNNATHSYVSLQQMLMHTTFHVSCLQQLVLFVILLKSVTLFYSLTKYLVPCVCYVERCWCIINLFIIFNLLAVKEAIVWVQNDSWHPEELFCLKFEDLRICF